MSIQNITTSVEEKLRALYNLQLIDSRIDEIKNVLGELPLEIEDLENAIKSIKEKLETNHSHKESVESKISEQKNKIEECNYKLKQYSERIKDVRNEREHESISREREYQTLEIDLAEKTIEKLKELIEELSLQAQDLNEKLEEREGHLDTKKSELDDIMAENKREEDILTKKSKEFAKKIDDDLIEDYQRIRSRFKNGLAIVTHDEQGAAGGSFFVIPPQLQLEIANRKRIIKDEHSGRILVDPHLAEEEQKKIRELV
ncbi:MAG: hypothetical protein OXC61_06650 [Flavobacteriaceae bacterium]|nr:hypothetical protein [Flavobacteriaceae bacterium]